MLSRMYNFSFLHAGVFSGRACKRKVAGMEMDQMALHLAHVIHAEHVYSIEILRRDRIFERARFPAKGLNFALSQVLTDILAERSNSEWIFKLLKLGL